MKINRDNYEEYFLLYTDHELSADLRREVESFVQQNPDLKEELEFFQSLKLQPDLSLELGDKDFLLKEVGFEGAGMEASMLLHLDRELDPEKAESLEAAIASDESLRRDWEILLKTRLQPETVVFERKEVLYRKESGIAPVFQMRWTRYAAAAALVLVAGLLWLNKGREDSPVPVTEIAQQVDQPEKRSGSGSLSTAPSPSEGTLEQAAAAGPGAPAGKLAASDLDREKGNMAPASSATQVTASRVQNRKPESKPSLVEAGKEESSLVAEEPLVARNLDNKPARPLATEITDQAVGSAEPEIRADYATRALLDQADGESIQAEAVQGSRKGPLRGIVRKANRIFHKVTNPDLDKPLVKVASFEIALAN